MNPDPTPAAHLPAPLPSPAALLHRTQGALGLLRDVVQESSAEYWYERGKAAMERKDWSNAFHYLKKCLDLSPNHWQSSLRLAVTELNVFENFIADNAALAIINAYNNAWVSRQIIQQELLSTEWNLIFKNLELEIEYSSFESPIFALAVLYWINDSKNELRQTLDLISKRTISLKSFGIWHCLSGNYWLNISSSGEARTDAMRHALQSFRYALEVDNSNPMVWLLSADTKMYLSDNQGAIIDYIQAIEIFPDTKDGFIGRGQAKSNLKLYEEAILDLDQAITIEPNNAYTYYLRAKTKLIIEDFEGCLVDCGKAIESKYPYYNLAASHNALQTRAAAKEKLGDTTGARRDWHDAISLARQWENANDEY